MMRDHFFEFCRSGRCDTKCNSTNLSSGDYKPYIQSQKLPRYLEVANQLVGEGYAYHCFCSKERLEMVRAEQKNSRTNPSL